MKTLLNKIGAYRFYIVSGILIILTAGNLLFSVRRIKNLVPLYTSFSQMADMEGEAGLSYPGAILPLIVSGKTVYAKDDFSHLEFDMSDPEAPWELQLKDIYHGINSRNLLEASGANVVCDPAFNESEITKEQAVRFTDLGYSNDLYRFSCAANDIDVEYGNYFHYYYYYTAKGQPMHIYLYAEDADAFTPERDEELVALWQPVEKGYGEDLYIMTKSWFDREVQK